MNLLRESRENAFKINDQDIDKMFNLKIGENLEMLDGLDKKSKAYLNKIIKIR